MQSVATLLCGSLVGFSLGLIGGGGSILAVPLLLYVVADSDPHVAIGTSAFAVGINAAVNLIGHWRRGNVKWPCAADPGAPLHADGHRGLICASRKHVAMGAWIWTRSGLSGAEEVQYANDVK